MNHTNSLKDIEKIIRKIKYLLSKYDILSKKYCNIPFTKEIEVIKYFQCTVLLYKRVKHNLFNRIS